MQSLILHIPFSKSGEVGRQESASGFPKGRYQIQNFCRVEYTLCGKDEERLRPQIIEAGEIWSVKWRGQAEI